MRAGRGLLAGILALAVPAVLAVGLVEWTRGPDRVALVEQRAGAAQGAGGASEGGGWRALPSAPLDPRWGAFSVWTGEHLLVWGGYAWPSDGGDEGPRADGAAFDGRRWDAFPEGPLPPGMRHDGVAAWTGEELLIAGGTGGDDGRTPLRDAAAYDPQDRTWRGLPDLPEPIAGGGWVGDRLVVLAAGRGARRPVYALAPDAARWRRLDPLPAAAGGDDLHVQGTDRHLFVVAQGAAWGFRPGGGWRRLPGPRDGARFEQVRGVTRDGNALVVLLADGTYRYRPQRARWSRVGGGLDPDATQAVPLLAAGGGLVAVDLAGAQVHTLTGDAWVRGPELPADRVQATAGVAGDRLVVWGGMGSEQGGAQGWTLPLPSP